VHQIVDLLESAENIEVVHSRVESNGVEILRKSLLDIAGLMRWVRS